MAIQRLTNAEISLMELLWETNPLTARQIRERLYDDSEKSQHGTVQRLLQSLEEKGFVSRDRSLGGAVVFANFKPRSLRWTATGIVGREN